jgi:hypothetical protein
MQNHDCSDDARNEVVTDHAEGWDQSRLCVVTCDAGKNVSEELQSQDEKRRAHDSNFGFSSQ